MTNRRPFFRERWLATGTLCLCALACGRSGPRPIAGSRTVDADTNPIRWNVTEAERFSLEAPARPPRFSWDLPEGWRELPGSQFREANFGIPAQPDVECYLSFVQGGGAFGNLNRWRGQMGLPPLTQQEVLDLPRRDFLGTKAAYAEMDGTFAGMGGAARPGYTLAGMVLEIPMGTMTLKLIGPADAVRAELEHFHALAASFAILDPGAAPPGQAQAEPDAARTLAWDVPAGWRVAEARMMRDVTFNIGDDTECWVSTLGGDGGGEAANLQRWRAEMGNAPVAAQESITMLGGRGTFVEIRGTYGGGRAGQPVSDAVMLATIRSLGDRTIFVKMIGPSAEVEANRGEFLQFCSSLR